MSSYESKYFFLFFIFIQDLLERETKNQEKYEKEKGRLVKFTEVGLTSIQFSWKWGFVFFNVYRV